jgi:hypothetical protein
MSDHPPRPPRQPGDAFDEAIHEAIATVKAKERALGGCTCDPEVTLSSGLAYSDHITADASVIHQRAAPAGVEGQLN